MNFAGIKTLNTLIDYLSNDFIVHLASTLNIPQSTDLSENLKTLAEWEYKYTKIQQAQKMNPKRKENILQLIHREINPIIDIISNKLLFVYKDWLRMHNLTSPNEWAKERLEFGNYDPRTCLNIIQKEYERYGGLDFNNIFFKYLINNDTIYLYELRNDIINILYTDINEATELNDINKIELLQNQILDLKNIDFTDENQLNKFIEYCINIFNFDINIIKEQLEFGENLENAALSFLAEQVFPLWSEYWKIRGMGKIKQNLEQISNDLETNQNKSIDQQFIIISKALNAVHRTGPMLNYIKKVEPEINEEFLNYLSNMDTSQWDSDLIEMGVW